MHELVCSIHMFVCMIFVYVYVCIHVYVVVHITMAYFHIFSM